MRPLLLNGYSKEELLSTKYGDYQREKMKMNTVSAQLLKVRALKENLIQFIKMEDRSYLLMQ
jgi:hypothetical protein